MDMPARTPGEPVTDRLRLVGRVVVHGRCGSRDRAERWPRRDPGTSGTPRCGGAGGTVR